MIQTPSLRSLGLTSKLSLFLLFVVSFSFISAQSQAAQEKSWEITEISWKKYQTLLLEQQKETKLTGWSYVASGALIAAGSSIGFFSSIDPAAKLVYTLSQVLGLVGIGYGAHLLLIPDDYELFGQTLQETSTLTEDQRTDLVRNFLSQKQVIQRRQSLLRSMVHGLIAVVNIYNGSRQSESTVRDTLYFIGAINIAAALTFTF